MTYAPASLKALATYWMSRGGVNLGIVGDAAHQARASYHNGRDVITKYGRTRETDYTIRTDRDWRGLTDAASAIDLGQLQGSYRGLREFSSWLVARCRINVTGTDMIREIIWSPDGATVLRWDRERGYASAPRAGEADSSHLTHTHISFYRDTEGQDKIGLFAPYFEEDTMATYFPVVTRTPFPAPATWRVAAGTTLRGYDPAQPGKVVKEVRFASPSMAHATARVGVSWVGTDKPPIPRGYPFLEVSDGAFKGLLIVEAQVTLDPIPDPCEARIVEARGLARGKALEEARAAAVDAVGKAIDGLPR